MSRFLKRFGFIILNIVVITTIVSFYIRNSSADVTKNLSVTATVPAQAGDFQANISSSTTGDPFPQDTTIDYQVTYGSYLSNPVGFTLQAQWYQGSLSGSSTPTVDVISYVIGSASNGYGSVTPVVDTVNHTIEWTFDNFPANTQNQTVNFQFKTTSSYSGSSIVTFPVAVRIIGPGVTTSDSRVSHTYQYYSTATATPTPTATPEPTSSVSSTSGPTATPTPTPTTSAKIHPFTIDDISMRAISQNSATIAILTSHPSEITFSYGTSQRNLTKMIRSSGFSEYNEIKLDDLDPNTQYFFRVTAVNKSGQVAHSDSYTFKTALISNAPQINPGSLVFVSDNVILYSGEEKSAYIVLPQKTTYSFNFNLIKPSEIKKIQVVIRNKQVLGLGIKEADAVEPNEQYIEVIPFQNGYHGQLKTPAVPAVYELFARIQDVNGNISESKMGEIRVTNNLMILDDKSRSGIESAQVAFYVFNVKTQTYYYVSPQQIAIKNPDFADLTGAIHVSLPIGKYKIKVTALGYENKEISFTVGRGESENYPVVYLKKTPFSITTLLANYSSTLLDYSTVIKSYFQQITGSNRFFSLSAFFILFASIILTLISFQEKTHIPLTSLLSYLYYRLNMITSKQQKTVEQHFVIDTKTKQPIAHLKIYLIDAKTNHVLGHTITNIKGSFAFTILPFRTYYLECVFPHSLPFIFQTIETHMPPSTKIQTFSIDPPTINADIKSELILLLRKVLSICFELFLLISVIYELFFGYIFEWSRVMPFFIMSTLNFVVWVFHEAQVSEENKIITIKAQDLQT